MLVSFSLMFGGGMMSGGGMMNGYGWNWGMMLLGSLGMIAFWIALMWGIVVLLRRNSDSNSTMSSKTNLEILQHRLAAGDINQAEYDSARHALGL